MPSPIGSGFATAETNSDAGQCENLMIHIFRETDTCSLLPGVLRVRLHAVGVHHPDYRHGVRHHCRHLLPAERGKLPLAMDVLLLSGLDRHLRVPLQYILLLHEDQDVGLLPNDLLLWVHAHVLPGTGHHVR